MPAGLVALGDSISYGHGGMQSGLGSQSWAMWLAEALDLPFTRYAVNGATAADVVRDDMGAPGCRVALDTSFDRLRTNGGLGETLFHRWC